MVVRYRRPADRRSRPQQWADAVQTLSSRTCWTGSRSGETTCPPASQTAHDGSARCRAGAARLRRRTPGSRAAKGLRTGLTTLIGGVTGRAPAEQIALATSRAVHIRLLGCEAGPRNLLHDMRHRDADLDFDHSRAVRSLRSAERHRRSSSATLVASSCSTACQPQVRAGWSGGISTRPALSRTRNATDCDAQMAPVVAVSLEIRRYAGPRCQAH